MIDAVYAAIAVLVDNTGNCRQTVDQGHVHLFHRPLDLTDGIFDDGIAGRESLFLENPS